MQGLDFQFGSTFQPCPFTSKRLGLDVLTCPNMYQLLRPLIFRLDPEEAHYTAMLAADWGNLFSPFVQTLFTYSSERLQQRLWGLDFANPVGLAAGFDKNARHIPFWSKVGFGFCEVGSVSAKASAGNPKPRAFRLPEDEALINRMGLNNDGARVISARIAQLKRRTIPLGINLAKTHSPDIMGEAAIEDFVTSFKLLAPLADYVAINISCPNTAEGKTFEDPQALNDLLSALYAVRPSVAASVPILVKLSPPADVHIGDNSQLDEVLSVLQTFGIDGLIATNTAPDRMGLKTRSERLTEIGRGGLSGKPIEARSTALIAYLYRYFGGKMPIIGVGGIDSAAAAYRKIKAGASLIQVYTGMVFQGPGLIKDINQGLINDLDADGFASLHEAVGKGNS